MHLSALFIATILTHTDHMALPLKLSTCHVGLDVSVPRQHSCSCSSIISSCPLPFLFLHTISCYLTTSLSCSLTNSPWFSSDFLVKPGMFLTLFMLSSYVHLCFFLLGFFMFRHIYVLQVRLFRLEWSYI